MNNLRQSLSLAAIAAALFGTAYAARADAPVGRYTIASETVVDAETHLTWQRYFPLSTYTWAGAGTYCQGLSAGGYSSGWRLPTIKELASIIDITKVAPTIDSVAFPGISNATFWSSTPYFENPGHYWDVGFFYGVLGSNGTATTLNVRCVR